MKTLRPVETSTWVAFQTMDPERGLGPPVPFLTLFLVGRVPLLKKRNIGYQLILTSLLEDLEGLCSRQELVLAAHDLGQVRNSA